MKTQLTKHKSTLTRILNYIGVYKWLVLLSLVLAAVTVATTLYAPILVGNGVDLILGPGNVDFAGLTAILKKIAVVIVITALAQWLMNHINNQITYRVVKDIRTKAFGHLETLPLSYIDSHQYGDINSRIIADIDQFSEGLLMGFTQLFTGVLTILGTLGFMLVVNPMIDGGGACDAAVAVCGELYREENVHDVPVPVADARRADFPDRRDGREPEGRAGVRLRAGGAAAV